MKKNILIIESTDCHTPYIETLMNIFSCNKNLKPYAFFNKKHEQSLKKDFSRFYNNNKNKFIIEKNDEGKYCFSKIYQRLKQVAQIRRVIILKKIDHITINTIQTKKNMFLILYLLFSKKKISLTIHDTEFDNRHLTDIIFSKLQSMLIKKTRFLFLLGDYLKEDVIIKQRNKIHIHYIYDNKLPRKKYAKKTIIIMNSPDTKKGDFEDVFCQLSSIKDMQIILPMKIRDEKIKDMIKKYNLLKRIKYFNEYVAEKKLLGMLQRSHIALIPKLFDDASGKRKISAGFSCAEGYSLPIIVHESYLWYKSHKIKNVYEFGDGKPLSKILKDNRVTNVKKMNTREEFEKINQKLNSFF